MARAKDRIRQQERTLLENEVRLQKSCAVLDRLLVKSIVVHYNESAKDGFIERVDYFPTPGAGIPEGILGLIKNYVSNYLGPLWENSDGSYGTMTIDVATRQVKVEDHGTVEEFEDEGEEIDP